MGVMLGIAGEEARKEAVDFIAKFHETGAAIRKIFGSVSPIHTLSRLAFYAIVEHQKFGSPGVTLGIESHELEVLQAMALSVIPGVDSNPERASDAVQDLLRLARENTQAFQYKSLLRLTDDDTKNRRIAVMERIRATTQTVRGTRQVFQTQKYLQDAAAQLDGEFLAEFGFSISHFISFFEGLAPTTADRMQILKGKARRWLMAEKPTLQIQYFLEDNPELTNHPLVSEAAPSMRTDEIRARLWMATETLFASVFQQHRPETETSEMRALHDMLMQRSLKFGDIAEEKIERIYLDNPVRLSPFVISPAGETYLFCVTGAIIAQLEILEELIRDRSGLSERYSDFKAIWLEQRVHEVVSSGFATAESFINSKWADAEGVPGETDCIVVLDKTIGLFEAKSGRITPPARRGAEDRLARQIDELMVKPSRQSARFAQLLRGEAGPISIETPGGPRRIGGSATREIIRVNIIFDTLGPLSACSKLLMRGGFVGENEPMAPTMSIFELELIFDLLPDQISRIHYLRRRMDLETSVLFDADEMDLLALYFHNCFCLGDLPPDAEGFSIYGWSDNLARVYDPDGVKRNPPKLKRIPLWESMIRVTEERADAGWTRFGYFLSNVPYREQWSLFRTQQSLFKRTRKLKPGQCAFSGAYNPGGGLTIVLCAGKNVSELGIYSHAEEAANNLMMQSGSKESLLIYWDTTFTAAPYTFIATMKRRG